MMGCVCVRSGAAPRNVLIVVVRPGYLSEPDNATRPPCALGSFVAGIASEMGGKAVILVAS